MLTQITSRPDGTELTNEDVQSGDVVVWEYEQTDGLITRCAYIHRILRELPDVPTELGIYISDNQYYRLTLAGWTHVLQSNGGQDKYLSPNSITGIHMGSPLRRLVPEG